MSRRHDVYADFHPLAVIVHVVVVVVVIWTSHKYWSVIRGCPFGKTVCREKYAQTSRTHTGAPIVRRTSLCRTRTHRTPPKPVVRPVTVPVMGDRRTITVAADRPCRHHVRRPSAESIPPSSHLCWFIRQPCQR